MCLCRIKLCFGKHCKNKASSSRKVVQKMLQIMQFSSFMRLGQKSNLQQQKQPQRSMFFCHIPLQFDAPAQGWFVFQPFQLAKVHNFQESPSQHSSFITPNLQDTKDNRPDYPVRYQSGSSHQQKEENEKKKQIRIKKACRNIKIKQVEQQQFDPRSRMSRKKIPNCQNQNRNVVPNIMHQAISFLHKKEKCGKMVQKLIIKLGLTEVCSVPNFFSYQKSLKDKMNHYLNARAVRAYRCIQDPACELYSEEEQMHYNRMSRMLIQHYLENEFAPSILTSKRVCSQKKYEHLAMRREILTQIATIFRE